jgi:hypothetical protein
MVDSDLTLVYATAPHHTARLKALPFYSRC